MAINVFNFCEILYGFLSILFSKLKLCLAFDRSFELFLFVSLAKVVCVDLYLWHSSIFDVPKN